MLNTSKFNVSNTNFTKNNEVPRTVKSKINERKRLIKTQAKVDRIKLLNKEIKSYFHNSHSSRVRRTLYPGNTEQQYHVVPLGTG